MTCFFLQKSLCGEFENIFARFWWQKGKGNKRIHWCQWKAMCSSREEGVWILGIWLNLIYHY